MHFSEVLSYSERFIDVIRTRAHPYDGARLGANWEIDLDTTTDAFQVIHFGPEDLLSRASSYLLMRCMSEELSPATKLLLHAAHALGRARMGDLESASKWVDSYKSRRRELVDQRAVSSKGAERLSEGMIHSALSYVCEARSELESAVVNEARALCQYEQLAGLEGARKTLYTRMCMLVARTPDALEFVDVENARSAWISEVLGKRGASRLVLENEEQLHAYNVVLSYIQQYSA